MKKVKKLLTLLAASTLLFAVSMGMTGCSDGSDDGQGNQTKTPESTETPATPTTPTTPTTPETPSGQEQTEDVTGTKTSTVTPESDENADIQIVMCGDSIMRTYEPASGDETGWGQVLQFYFDKGVFVNNTLSNGGRSSKSFYYEKGRWENVIKILDERKAAGKKTYVFINFGHNDQKYIANGDTYMNYATYAKTNPDGWASKTYTKESNVIDSYNPSVNPDNGTYKDFLKKYIDETKARGATPVIFSPFVRCYSSNNLISDKGAHILSEAYTNSKENESAPRGDYPAAAKEVATENSVPYVDLTTLSKAYVESALAQGKEKFVYWPNDTTHACTLGALKIAEMAVNGLKDQIPELKSHMITPAARIMVRDNTIDFGRMYPGNESVKSFKVSAFNVTSGKITITAPDGYTLCDTENGTFSKKLEINTDANYFGTEVYVKFVPAEVKEYNHNLQITHSSITPDFGNSPVGCLSGKILLIALTGAGKQKAAGGQDYTVTWPMIDSAKAVIYTANVNPEGALSPSAATLGSGLKASTAKADAVNKVYRSRFCSSGTKWLASRDENTYIQFALPSGSSTVIVNKITLNLASSGTGSMRWDVLYSTSDDFSSPVTIIQGGQGTAIDQDGATSAKANDVLTEVTSEADMGMSIAGKTLYVRVYPYMNKEDTNPTGRLLMVGDVKIEGLIQ